MKTGAWFLAIAGALLAACTYDVHIDRAAENLDLNLIYSPCTEDAGHDAEGDR